MRNATILAALIALFGVVSAVQASNDDLKRTGEKTYQTQKSHDRYERKSDARAEYSEPGKREHEARERHDEKSKRHDDRDDRN